MTNPEAKQSILIFGRAVNLQEAAEMGVAIGAFVATCIHGVMGNGGAGVVDLFIAAFVPPLMIVVDSLRK